MIDILSGGKALYVYVGLYILYIFIIILYYIIYIYTHIHRECVYITMWLVKHWLPAGFGSQSMTTPFCLEGDGQTQRRTQTVRQTRSEPRVGLALTRAGWVEVHLFFGGGAEVVPVEPWCRP